MENKHFLRGMATVNFWADDVAAARDWYAELFGVEAYFQQPNAEHPAYVEFRIGVLAEQARHVHPGRRQRRIDCRWNQHLDDRRA